MAQERAVAVFLVGLAVLLGTARVLGELARALRFPAVAGELAAGVLLGPTVLGRVAPGSVHALFPPGPAATMLAAYATVASVLLLTVAGLEIDLNVVLRRRREAATTSLMGVALPMVLGVALGWLLPGRYLVDPGARWVFAVFIGTALSISAMPVIAKTLMDLGFFRTGLGLLIMASAMVDDLLGWLLFSLLSGPMHGGRAGWGAFALRLLAVLAFAAAMIGLGRRLFDRVLAALERDRISAAGRVLSLLIVAAVLGAAVTQGLGVHAVFGAFLVGVAVGQSRHLRAETRGGVHEFVSNVFAPVFFATIGLRVDFVAAFDLPLVLTVFAVACLAKGAGSLLGARVAGVGWREAWGVAFAMNSRGAMEIILALVALEAGLIRPQLFVALVAMALTTSLIAGPAMQRLLARKPGAEDVAALLEEGAVVPELRAHSPEQALRELVQALAAGTPLDANTLADAVIEQDAVRSGGLVDGIAVPFAVVPGVTRPMLAFGRAPGGLDFNARDGRAAHMVFLLLLPPAQSALLIELHMAIVYVVATTEQRVRLLLAEGREGVLEAVRCNRGARTTRPSMVRAPRPVEV
jgi:Kef-type K+ transport system membrane component KefB/mannitol/fructose-specific phosphotransferase system IIA component (Ntr-type)